MSSGEIRNQHMLQAARHFEVTGVNVLGESG
jgi:hypothetical protein